MISLQYMKNFICPLLLPSFFSSKGANVGPLLLKKKLDSFLFPIIEYNWTLHVDSWSRTVIIAARNGHAHYT